MVEWIQKSLACLLIVAGLVLVFPLLAGLMAIVAPVRWKCILAVAYTFRILVGVVRLHGIAKLLEAVALVALGVAEYFHSYEIDKDYGQLAYFGVCAER